MHVPRCSVFMSRAFFNNRSASLKFFLCMHKLAIWHKVVATGVLNGPTSNNKVPLEKEKQCPLFITESLLSAKREIWRERYYFCWDKRGEYLFHVFVWIAAALRPTLIHQTFDFEYRCVPCNAKACIERCAPRLLRERCKISKGIMPLDNLIFGE